MFDWIDRSGLRRVRRVFRDAQKQYRVDLASVRSQGLEGVDLENAEFGISVDVHLAEDAYDHLVTDSLVSQAEDRDILVPDMSGESRYWMYGFTNTSLYLSDEGVVFLRSAIRVRRRESWMFGFQIVSIAIGLLGAMAAVLSLIVVLITT